MLTTCLVADLDRHSGDARIASPEEEGASGNKERPERHLGMGEEQRQSTDEAEYREADEHGPAKAAHLCRKLPDGKVCLVIVVVHIGGDVKPPNDPSSATRPTRASDCNRDAMAGFAAAHG